MDEKAQMSTKNSRIHIRSLSMTKLADGLLDPKLVLAWLLVAIGGSAFWVGLLVPVRESGALLPQLLISEPIRRMPIRKWAWIAGSVVQGFAAAGIAIAALLLEGAMAGVVIVGLVGVLAIARSVSSVSYKDVLGKTVEKSGRGKVSGTATSIAAAGVFLFGFLLVSGMIDRYLLVIGALFFAGALWIVAALLFARLPEHISEPAAPHSGGYMRLYWHYLMTDTELQRLLVARALLVSTAIAPPYLILLAGESTPNLLRPLGSLVIASSLAALVSGYIWGVIADQSTPRVLTLSGLSAATALLAAVYAASAGLFTNLLTLPLILFVLLVAYQGVRIGRTTHLVNIANEDTRTGYTAITNTIIGIVLIATGVFGWIALTIGVAQTIAILAGMSLLGGLVSYTLTP